MDAAYPPIGLGMVRQGCVGYQSRGQTSSVAAHPVSAGLHEKFKIFRGVTARLGASRCVGKKEGVPGVRLTNLRMHIVQDTACHFELSNIPM